MARKACERRRRSATGHRPAQEPTPLVRSVAGHGSGRVLNIAFEVSCPKALRANMAYPSWGVLDDDDDDDDGRSGGTDLGYTGQCYGWSASADWEVPPEAWQRVTGTAPLHGPMLEGSPDFRGGLFP
jgi:hypothetical protein